MLVALALDDLPGASTAQGRRSRARPRLGGAYGGFYKALELGPIAIVSPIASSNGAMVVVLAVMVLGESLTAVQALGCAGARVHRPGGGGAEGRAAAGRASGMRLALVATVAFGRYLFALATLTDDLGWLVPILLTRAVAVALLAAFFARRPRRLGVAGPHACWRAWPRARSTPRLSDVQPRRRARRGGDHERGGLLLPVDPDPGRADGLRERVAWYQLVGVGGVLAGMVVLSLG